MMIMMMMMMMMIIIIIIIIIICHDASRQCRSRRFLVKFAEYVSKYYKYSTYITQSDTPKHYWQH